MSAAGHADLLLAAQTAATGLSLSWFVVIMQLDFE